MDSIRIGGPWWIRGALWASLVTGIACGVVFVTGLGTDSAAADVVANPLRAVVSEQLLEWKNWLEDGSFEDGTIDYEVLPHPVERLASASARRSAEGARTGTCGIRIVSEPGQGTLFAVRSDIEKGERTRCTFWARSLDRPTDLRVSVLGVDRGHEDAPRTLHELESPVSIGTEWTRVQFAFANTHGVDDALLAIDVGPNRTIDIDDVSIEAEQWRMQDRGMLERTVGGIPVPITPLAPVHFSVLIHIEDPRLITQQPGYFWQKTTVFTELARTLHEHGGFLTIQPEEDWPMASLEFAPTTLSDLAEAYGVVYSTHTHGPACVDADGRLRSNQDCNDCRTCPGWATVETDADPTTPEYVGALRDLISEISGTSVSDHNGNWHYDNASALADVGISTWSAFKNHNTQATFDALFTNPWRPTMCDAIEDTETFFVHDPATDVIFVPGWGQAITRHPERIHDRLAAMLSQVLYHADPTRVNTFYIVTHVDHYRPGGDEAYIDVDPVTGAITLGEGFLRDLGYWEETLTELIDPLVAEGYLEWTSLPDIGELFETWEDAHLPR